MSNHFHILLEIAPRPVNGILNQELLKRPSETSAAAFVAVVAKELAAMLRCRVRYFTAGAVIASRAFVKVAFAAARERFTEKRKDGARRLKGDSNLGVLSARADETATPSMVGCARYH